MTEERRLVTVLFADVVGSTAIGEAFDPEDVRPLLARLFAIARDAVEEHGGRVEKYIGDTVIAVFDLPVAHDDGASSCRARTGVALPFASSAIGDPNANGRGSGCRSHAS